MGWNSKPLHISYLIGKWLDQGWKILGSVFRTRLGNSSNAHVVVGGKSASGVSQRQLVGHCGELDGSLTGSSRIFQPVNRVAKQCKARGFLPRHLLPRCFCPLPPPSLALAPRQQHKDASSPSLTRLSLTDS